MGKFHCMLQSINSVHGYVVIFVICFSVIIWAALWGFMYITWYPSINEVTPTSGYVYYTYPLFGVASLILGYHKISLPLTPLIPLWFKTAVAGPVSYTASLVANNRTCLQFSCLSFWFRLMFCSERPWPSKHAAWYPNRRRTLKGSNYAWRVYGVPYRQW